MTTREYEGRSPAEAAIKACDDLGVSRSTLQYEVLKDESGDDPLSRRVLIAVDVAKSTENAKAAPKQESNEQESGSSEERPRNARSSRGGGRGRDDRGGRGGGRQRRGGRGRDDRGGRGDGRQPRGGRGRPGGGSNRDAGREEGDGLESMLNLEIVPSEPVELRTPLSGDGSERAEIARGIIQEVLDKMDLGMKPQLVEDAEEEIHFDIVGEDEARVIGKKGEALLALQFLVNRIVTRKSEGDQHIVLDAAGYRMRRRAALGGLAEKLAGRAVEEQKVVRLSPMSAHDRRVFHVTLAEMDGVSTRSEGSGLFRPLLIIPGEE